MQWWTSIKSFFSKKESIVTHENGYETVRARTKKGQFIADDPKTKKNEAYKKVKVKKKKK